MLYATDLMYDCWRQNLKGGLKVVERLLGIKRRLELAIKRNNLALTTDLSVFPDFQKKILSSIKEGISFNLSVKKGEYSVLLDETVFRKELLKKLESDYEPEFFYFIHHISNRCRSPKLW